MRGHIALRSVCADLFAAQHADRIPRDSVLPTLALCTPPVDSVASSVATVRALGASRREDGSSVNADERA